MTPGALLVYLALSAVIVLSKVVGVRWAWVIVGAVAMGIKAHRVARRKAQ